MSWSGDEVCVVCGDEAVTGTGDGDMCARHAVGWLRGEGDASTPRLPMTLAELSVLACSLLGYQEVDVELLYRQDQCTYWLEVQRHDGGDFHRVACAAAASLEQALHMCALSLAELASKRQSA